MSGRSVTGPTGNSHAEADVDVPEPSPVPAPGPLRTKLTRSDIGVLLDELDEAMTEAEITGMIELVGGAALALAYYDRLGTTDVDGAIYPSPEIIALADEVGARHGLKAGWLNNAAQGFIPPGDTGDEPQTVRQGTSLTVTAAGARTLLAMKLRAARPIKDADDIAFLLRECGVTSLEGAKAVLEEMYNGEHELTERGERMVLGALGARSITQADGQVLQLHAVTSLEPVVCGKWAFRLDRRCDLPPDHTGDCAGGSAEGIAGSV
ncbi:MAG TPA: hypothetical protein VNQ33_09615 [Acidimicrobiales bacterium]|nr:hypothetical protein [Acidimicrobiales bacterium]